MQRITIHRLVGTLLRWSLLLGCLLFIGIHIAAKTVTIWDGIAYIGVVVLIKLLFFPTPIPKITMALSDWIFIGGTIIIHLFLLSVFASVPWHFHFDEFIVAYTSLTLPPAAQINWFGAYPPMWVAQFPLLFYLLQKPFLLFGPLIWAVRISVWPYAIGILIYLYFLVKSLWSKYLARIAVLIFVFFAPELYITSTGLHFISSEFFYLAALTHFILYMKTKSTGHLFPLTVYIVACYLTYTSSYAIVPVVLISALILVIWNRLDRRLVLSSVAKVSVASCVLFLPFLLYHFLDTPFLTQRISQVNIVNGSWSSTAEKLKSGMSMTAIITKQTKDAFSSLIVPGIGGMGGYEYGHRALLTPIEGILFVVGCIILFGMVLKKQWVFPVSYGVLMIIPFITGFVLTTHPPPFHRISILYPWICIPIALAIDVVAGGIGRYTQTKKGIYVAVLLIVSGMYSLIHVSTMIQGDKIVTNWDSVRITRLIEQTVKPGLPILIGADNTNFHYFYELTFRFGTKRTVSIKGKNEAVKSFQGNGPLLLRSASDENMARIFARYPNVRVYREAEHLPFLDITLIIPPSSFIDIQ